MLVTPKNGFICEDNYSSALTSFEIIITFPIFIVPAIDCFDVRDGIADKQGDRMYAQFLAMPLMPASITVSR